jgi:hypothetical protein
MILASLRSRVLLPLTALLGGLLLVLATIPSGSARAPMKDEQSPLNDPTVAAGLKWLALHQAPDGHWSLNEFNRHARQEPFPRGKLSTCNCTGTSTRRDDIAGTGFALLPFLAAGVTHKAANKDEAPVDYSKTVQAGLRFLMSKQGKDGYFGNGMYSHAIAAMAMCNAFGLSSDPQLKASAQRGIDYIIAAQDPAGGGWRYAPRQPGDTSVTGWQMQALKSGQLAGLNVPAQNLKMAEKFLDSVETQPKGGYCYVPGGGETPSMTAAGLTCRTYLGANPKNPGLLAGIDKLKLGPPGKTNNLYYEYYATQTMHHFGGETGEMWLKGTEEKPGMVPILTKQMDNGLTAGKDHQKGSWSPGQAGQVTEGGRIMATSLSLLMLEMPAQKLPLFRRAKEEQ